MQSLPEATNYNPVAFQCAALLLETLPGLMRFVRRQMRGRRAKGLSVPQFRTLVQLRRRPAASLSSICECLGSSPPTVSRIVSGLAIKRLVDRKTSTRDRRQTSLQLTRRGQAVLDTAWSGTQGAMAEKLSHLSQKQLAILAEAVNLLSGTFPASGEDLDELAGDNSRSNGGSPRSITSMRRPAARR